MAKKDPNNKTYQIFNDLQNGIDYYDYNRDLPKAIELMNIHKEFECQDPKVYYYVMTKVYAYMRYVLYSQYQNHKK